MHLTPEEWVLILGITALVTYEGVTPGQRPDDPAMWAVWKKRG